MSESIVSVNIEDCKLPFEWWFVDCIIAALDNPLCPDNYLWDISNCQEWKDRYDIGMPPKEAVNSKFCKH